MNGDSYLYAENYAFLEKIYEEYLQSPLNVDPNWVAVFNSLCEDVKSGKVDVKELGDILNSIKAMNLISAYRNYGYSIAKLDPLNISNIESPVSLEPEFYGINDLSVKVDLHGVLGLNRTSFSAVIERVKSLYCSSIMVEYMHLEDPIERRFIEKSLEKEHSLTKEEKLQMLSHLLQGESLESFIHVKFPGAKRFSLEGSESTLISMEEIIKSSMASGIDEIVLGMAHRGRLNFLTKIFGKPYVWVFLEFMGKSPFPPGLNVSGDVKYHLGCHTRRDSGEKSILLTMLANPSHLESVNPVVLGTAKAKQIQDKKNVLSVLVHGDASFSGQGIIYESMIVSTVEDYNVGGTIHIIINNQIGFTATPDEGRGLKFSSFIGKSMNVPIFHVNGDCPEEVARVSKIAFDFREKFKRDVIVDLISYRRHGHNEGDEPRFTNPLMYKVIDSMKNIKELYAEKLIVEGCLSRDAVDKMQHEFRALLDQALLDAKSYVPGNEMPTAEKWKGFVRPKADLYSSLKTAIPVQDVKSLADKLYRVPSSFNVNPKILKILEDRRLSIYSGKNIDWGTAEALAFASILVDGIDIRLTGQDSERGTFSHRHAVLVDQQNEREYVPLNNLEEKQSYLHIANSPLSEYGVLGFEYGYSLVNPNSLTIWEAQFGDFANGAQIIIDQYIVSAYTKWLDYSGLVLLLPHGYEGQGPEHSSARIERFLQLAAEDNMQVVNLTVPANYFHILRRQVLGNFRSPLVVFTPKSLLRHKMAVSEINEFSGRFQEIIPEIHSVLCEDKIKKVILCSGKVYYDLLQYRTEKGIQDVAIIRVEQFYPFPGAKLQSEISKYKNAKFVWVQEEPKNMGGWVFIKEISEEIFGNRKLSFVGREQAAATSCGYLSVHVLEQKSLVEEAFS